MRGGGQRLHPKAQPGARQPGGNSQPPLTRADVRQLKALQSQDIGTQASTAGTVAWAVVTSGGTLLGGSPEAAGATRYGPGQYQVLFTYEVNAKAFVATIGTRNPDDIPPAGEISVAPRYNNTKAVFVQTRNSSGTPADRPFHLVVAN